MTALKIPKQVEIGGRIITIKVDHNLDDFGQYHADDRKILLGHKATLSRAVLIETIRHEMVHAALDIGGVSYNKVMEEESIVRCLDTLFHPSWEKVRSILIK
jgi:hypothetical protein